MAASNYYSTLLVVAPKRELEVLKTGFNSILRDTPGVVGAASMLPNSIGISARFLTDRAPTMQATYEALRTDVRRVVLGRGPLRARM